MCRDSVLSLLRVGAEVDDDENMAMEMRCGSKVAALVRYLRARSAGSKTLVFVEEAEAMEEICKRVNREMGDGSILPLHASLTNGRPALRLFREEPEQQALCVCSRFVGDGLVLDASHLVIMGVQVVSDERRLISRICSFGRCKEGLRVHRIVASNTHEQISLASRSGRRVRPR